MTGFQRCGTIIDTAILSTTESKIKMPKKTKVLTVRLPKKLHKKAKAKSNRTGTTLAFIVRTALKNWVDEPEEELDQR